MRGARFLPLAFPIVVASRRSLFSPLVGAPPLSQLGPLIEPPPPSLPPATELVLNILEQGCSHASTSLMAFFIDDAQYLDVLVRQIN